MRRLDQTARLLATAVALTCALGCSGDPEAAPEALPDTTPAEVPAGPVPDEATGSVSLALTAPGGAEFDTFEYVITGPSYTKSGSIDVSDSTTAAVVIGGIPAGPSYSLTLGGMSTGADRASCTGSATFTVAAGEVTEVPVAVACHLEAVPIPQFASAALGVLLLAIGTALAGQRRERCA